MTKNIFKSQDRCWAYWWRLQRRLKNPYYYSHFIDSHCKKQMCGPQFCLPPSLCCCFSILPSTRHGGDKCEAGEIDCRLGEIILSSRPLGKQCRSLTCSSKKAFTQLRMPLHHAVEISVEWELILPPEQIVLRKFSQNDPLYPAHSIHFLR